jgi:hypothetical protein
MVDGLAKQATALAWLFADVDLVVADIKQTTLAEMRALPPHDTLRSLQAFFTETENHPYRLRAPHKALLTDILCVCEAVSAIVQDVRAALLQADTGRSADGPADPAQLFREYPVEVIAATVRSAMQKLEGSQK